MDYKKLDTILNNFINDKNNTIYLDNIKQIIQLCEKIINQPEISLTNNLYSTNYNLNDSINMIINFLGNIDESLKGQFEFLVTHVDESGEPILKFNTGKGNKVEDGKIYVDLENNLNDIFNIIHESFHYMNYYQLYGINDNNEEFNLGESYVRKFYGEAISVTAEKLFGIYLVQNNFINENDYNIRMNERLKATKKDAEAVILESEYIKMIQSGLEINEQNLQNIILKFTDDQIRSNIISEEYNSGKYTFDILNKNNLQFPIRQRYVIAQHLSETFDYSQESIKKFLYLHNEVGNIDSDLKKVTRSL